MDIPIALKKGFGSILGIPLALFFFLGYSSVRLFHMRTGS